MSVDGVPNSQREADIRFFFDYFRRQIEAIDHLAERQFLSAQHVIAGAALDSLAGHWAEAVKRAGCKSAGDRMQRFLETHADANIFARVSQPHLMRRARAALRPTSTGDAPRKPQGIGQSEAMSTQQTDRFVEVRREAARAKHEGFTGQQLFDLQRAAPDLPCGQLRRWEDDPRLDDLAARVAKFGISSPWLARSTYGRLIYKFHRCGWIHEFGAGPDLGHEFAGESLDFIGYENREGRARLVIPIGFMRTTLVQVIGRFERECLRTGIVPARNLEDEDCSDASCS